MRVSTASEAGTRSSPNEDWAMASENLIVVLDGATARTGTGCVHGIAWYAAKLGSALAGLAADRDTALVERPDVRHPAHRRPAPEHLRPQPSRHTVSRHRDPAAPRHRRWSTWYSVT